MQPTPALIKKVKDHIEKRYDGNMRRFAETTVSTRQTWMNLLSDDVTYLRPQTVEDLCNMFNCSEIQLYQIAHPDEFDSAQLKEDAAEYIPGGRIPPDQLAELQKIADQLDIPLMDYIRKRMDDVIDAAKKAGIID